MISNVIVVLLSVNIVVSDRTCYWNAECPFQLYSTKTPYDTVRGDIRDYNDPTNCQAVSVWTLNRHGNRNPGSSVTESIRVIAGLKDEIIQSHEAGRGQLCAQDIEDFRRWSWNATLETSASFLTGTGYEEIYNIAKRLRERYPHLLQGLEDSYFRTTNEQRTVTSSMAFVHGLTENTNLSVTVDGPYERDDLIRPYENCDKYQQEVKGSQELEDQMDAYFKTIEFLAVQSRVQNRLGLITQLTAEDVYSFYEICRFYRSWTDTLKSPWCAAFTDEDLVVLEYRDDVRHYYRNGYGSWVNGNLGGIVVKDLYDNFASIVNGTGRSWVSYFTHDTMLEMAYCALGLFKDNFIIEGSYRNPNRLWKTSNIACFSVNIIAVLNSCQESGTQTYRVQFFVNEKVSDLCPLEGCTWQQFQEKYSSFSDANLNFCSLDAREPGLPNGAAAVELGLVMIAAQIAFIALFR
ncbi:multiple inositol polyphosphate phosphatase 1-like [Plodia interpunctella]|uniref:multiple inositol polyphosphate phosphatase 1-like n=1 Tax=Plodia interpunctella TaxID=58824 RepID=UPI002367EE5D|nr:multiple inositol polyphosphate phosphatase 1-like [Plodia interpunctella]XP_053609465.1 multiple inositol polyphosphate phosphatase 1-like [Plodia interpunctella]